MKSISLFIIFIGLAMVSTSQQKVDSQNIHETKVNQIDSTNVDVLQFRRSVQEWKNAYNEDNVTKLESMYAKDAEYISSHVAGLVAHGRDRVIANFHKGITGGGHIDSVEILSANVSCNLATLVCKYQATNSGQKAVGRNLLVMKKINGVWLIVTHMTVV
ncbi:MAG: nuclear transport factor 2 family protein [Candidatus Bathyarchaeia archaeon]|jgi:ketosteroid isomerase-like protein